MKILVALAVFFLVSTQLLAEEIGANDDLNYWSDWSDRDQIKEELPEPFEHLLQRIARRPKPQQFFGLMGKRDADSSTEKQVALLQALYGHGQLSHKRHKTDSFVGLMGKRALNSGIVLSINHHGVRHCLRKLWRINVAVYCGNTLWGHQVYEDDQNNQEFCGQITSNQDKD
ncbi:protachykinin-1 isoform X1 [Globicephala melas]|uniref:protachykinin-1 isoform X1 n=1 Tax=Globicephala melas TaxID=9731 RepID=UPI00293D2AB3|nr:protachykinin-1 isoform X1 [Globicephala melas]XP_060160988.1 protachykinin-1 isoform X1 [Globicephala melas]